MRAVWGAARPAPAALLDSPADARDRAQVRVEVHAGEVLDFDRFLHLPGPALALDGYVEGPTRIENGFDHVSFNHHEGCSRLATRATCEQVALALCGRLGGWWRREGVTAHVNDADADVCLSVWLLANAGRVHEPGVSRLVTAESWLDSTSGCIAPALDDDEAGRLAWVFAPCFAVPPGSPATALATTLDEVAARVDAHLAGTGGRLAAACDYETRWRTGTTAVVAAASPLARSRFVRDGIDAYVMVRGRDGGRWHLSVGLSDPCTPMDLAVAYASLNALEGCSGDQRWSGSDTVGGSPRRLGTGLDPEQVAEVVAGALGL